MLFERSEMMIVKATTTNEPIIHRLMDGRDDEDDRTNGNEHM